MAIPLTKPYYQVPIQDCGEPLVPIPLNCFAVQSPHPYVQRGAPYGVRSPYFLRQGVLERLITAQTALQAQRPGWRLSLFDAYRPIAVQRFMVEETFAEQLEASGWGPDLTPQQAQQLWDRVYQFWALPSGDAATPPPHSTGAAVDLTLVDEVGQPVDMGSPIDEISPRSYPDHFAPNGASKGAPSGSASDPNHARFHRHRQILNTALSSAGFCRHRQEWWHFSYGDQMWAWFTNQEQ
ncbi:MAG: M15 family metallopeptidase, partial [Elainellaceae cyanobacterium]